MQRVRRCKEPNEEDMREKGMHEEEEEEKVDKEMEETTQTRPLSVSLFSPGRRHFLRGI